MSNKKPKIISKRHRARIYALQGLYSWQLSQNNIAKVREEILADNEIEDPAKIGVDLEYFTHLLTTIPKIISELDAKISPFMSRDITQCNPIELNILRIAVYELVYQPNLPPKVILNEAIELAKMFGAEDGHKFVNGVLDKAKNALEPIALSA